MARLARGSLPWPEPPGPGHPACRGTLTVEAAIAAGARLRVTAWPRQGPDGMTWLSLEVELYPKGGRSIMRFRGS
jgi:hypothetical protein